MNIRSFLSGGAIGSALTLLITQGISLYIAQNENSSTYVEIAANVLSANKEDNGQAIREWAVNVIDIYAADKIKMNDDLKRRLINGEILLTACGSGAVTELGADTARGSASAAGTLR